MSAETNAFAFDQRHVLYAKLRPYLNKVSLPQFEGRCSTEAIPLLPTHDLDRRYLAAYLKRQETLSAVMAEKTGSRMPRADMRALLRLPIPLPPLNEQRRIADRLDAAMTEIAAARAALVRQRQEVANLASRAVEAAIGGRAIASSDDPGAEGENWAPLSTVARLESGHTPSRKHPEWWGGDVPWMALPDIRALDGKTATTTGEQTNELGLANSSARLLPIGTVVFCRDVNVGYLTVLGVPMATSQHFVNWVPGQQLRTWYLAHALMNARQYLRCLSEGSIIKTIYMPTLKGLRIRLPSLAEQDKALQQIEEVIAHQGHASGALDRQADALDALGRALLSAAFRGEL